MQPGQVGSLEIPGRSTHGIDDANVVFLL